MIRGVARCAHRRFAKGVLVRPFLLVLSLIASLQAQETVSIPNVELSNNPSAARVAALVDHARTQGWGSTLSALQLAARQAYEGNTGYAPSWYYAYRWASLLGTPYNKAIQDWIAAVQEAKVGHPNMAASYESHRGSLSAGLSRELLLALVGNPALSEEFFQLLKPVDNPSAVLGILQKIHQEYPALFLSYANLALAIAVVYDVPPSPVWPHGQVSDKILPRKMPAPEQVFGYLVRLDQRQLTLHRLTRLPADELKFLVDLAAPFSELDWARTNVPGDLTTLSRAYDMIKYRKDRIAKGQFSWPGQDYHLPNILKEGGICVDQAYFASSVGQAKGIPTILFRGAGQDGRHAWFGYLGSQQKWQLDCGRYAEQKFVVGVAFDPQTWGDINDHELLFITERFRALPTYKLSVMHAEFAADYLQEGKFEQARQAAREAVNRDRRNLAAWNTLLQAQAGINPELRMQEAIVREAILAFQKYPDLEIAFSRRMIQLLRARGETSLAQVEENRLVTKYRVNRVDLSIDQAAATISRSAQKDDLATQIRVFNQVLDTSGRGATIDFFDKVVEPFVEHLVKMQQLPAALQTLDRARRTLRVEPASQLEKELNTLTQAIRSGNIPSENANE